MTGATLALLLGATPLFSQGRTPLERLAVPEGLASVSDCGRCHLEQTEQWRASRHSVSASNEVYLAGHALEPMVWCENCHAPARLSGEPDVGCATCHVRDGVILSANELTENGVVAHPMRLEPRLATDVFCGECHQFPFPQGHRDPVVFGPHLMQRTLDEAKKLGATRTCQQCHFPKGSHRAAGGHDVETVRRAVQVSVEPGVTPSEVRVRLRAREVDHRVPTGDPFRRLRLELCEDRSCAKVLATRELGRHIVPVEETWRLTDDETLSPDQDTVVELEHRGARWLRVTLRFAAISSEPHLSPDERAVELYLLPLQPAALSK